MFSNLFSIDEFDMIFVLTAAVFNLLIAGIFIFVKRGNPRFVRFLGVCVLFSSVPFGVVFIHYLGSDPPLWVLVYFGLIFLYLLVELLMDFILKIEFRKKWYIHIPYIVLEYAALFGLLGIAFQIDRSWGMIVSVPFWLLLASLIYMYWGRKKPRYNAPSR